MVELINEPINERFFELVSSSKSSIKLCAPFVKKNIVDSIFDSKKSSSSIECISFFKAQNFCKRASDIEAFETLSKQNASLYNCQNLHAKIYIFDEKKLIVTSANLTYSGFNKNIEYGVYIDDIEIVQNALNHYKEFAQNEDTGKNLDYKKIQSIKNLLNTQTAFIKSEVEIEYEFDSEINDLLELENKQGLSSIFTSWEKTLFSVLDTLEHDYFTTNDMKIREDLFKREFPNNNTIIDSVRKNLQHLRDLGLIQFLGNGHYKKLWK